jgi:glycosyltransferase involved in cell wall biosynthesis
MDVFYLAALLATIQGVVSLLDGLSHLRYVHTWMQSSQFEYTPRAAVIVPCKGAEPDLSETARAIIGQDYPDFIVVFVVESKDDLAYSQIKCVIGQAQPTHVHLIEAGRAADCGQKVHNLLAALDHLESLETERGIIRWPAIEVYAFTDSDAQAKTQWLRHLVAPLGNEQVGATTGYRWYIPEATIWALLRSIWNASAVTALGAHKRNFAWGGSMAIRRQTAQEIGLRDYWRGAVSDDYQLSAAVKRSGRYIKFVPRCLLPSRGACSFGELLEFTTRQMTITRAYSPKVWLIAGLSNLFFTLVVLVGLAIVVGKDVMRVDATWASVGLWVIYLLGVAKAVLRSLSVEMMLIELKRELRRTRLAYWLLYPLGSFLFAYSFLASALSRKIKWRGIRYELKAPNETLILSKEEG